MTILARHEALCTGNITCLAGESAAATTTQCAAAACVDTTDHGAYRSALHVLHRNCVRVCLLLVVQHCRSRREHSDWTCGRLWASGFQFPWLRGEMQSNRCCPTNTFKGSQKSVLERCLHRRYTHVCVCALGFQFWARLDSGGVLAMMGTVYLCYFQHLKNRSLSGFPEHPAVAYTCAIALLASHGAIPRVFNAEINCAHVGDLGSGI